MLVTAVGWSLGGRLVPIGYEELLAKVGTALEQSGGSYRQEQGSFLPASFLFLASAVSIELVS